MSGRLWLDRIWAVRPLQRVKILNVCGGHERVVSAAGLRSALPPEVEIVPGPGCPVCVCPEAPVRSAIGIALSGKAIVVSFGDMLRVPVTGSKAAVLSLEAARAAGGDVRPIASPREAVRIARANPDRKVVFLAVGFETTMAPVAAMLLEGVPDNLLVLLAGRRTWPAVSMLLGEEEPGFEALIAPGHVAAVMGADEWGFVSKRHHMPTAVAGFTAESLLAAIYATLRQLRDGIARLDNCYPEVVSAGGNSRAQEALRRAFEVIASDWRGIGTISSSGYALKPEFCGTDAAREFAPTPAAQPNSGEMPRGCDCAKVVLGKKRPDQCRLFGRACTPRQPVGPCMVSDEGACRIWWSTRGIREAETAA